MGGEVPAALRVLWEGVIARLPRWWLRRLYPASRVVSNFGVELLAPRALELTLRGSAVPTFVVRLRYVNLNPFPVTVERVDFEIWFGQPIIDDQKWLKHVVSPHTAYPPIDYSADYRRGEIPPRFEFQLGGPQLTWLETQTEAGRLKCDVSLWLHLYGTAIGREFVKERQRIEIPAHEIELRG